uniref:Centromere protein Q n=1 Tax=Taeniopygia guttata TaxID=59729 RepID=A0A674H607_TAEGU
MHSRGCLKIATFVVIFSLQQVPQTDKRKVKDLKDYSPAGRVLFFPVKSELFYTFDSSLTELSHKAVCPGLTSHPFPFFPFVITGENGSSKKVKLSSATIRSWQPLSENSRQFLENTVDSVVLSVLSQQTEEKDDVQKHLNVLKNRVLRSFKTLTVPPGKLGNLKNILGLQMAEKQMLETNEESLVQLQEEITEAERSAELIEENIQQLQYKIQVLKNQLKKDEENARKVFQENGSGALQLPELPKCSFQAPTLQEEILKVKNQKGLLKDMNAIQQSANLKNLLTLIEKTYEKVDLL